MFCHDSSLPCCLPQPHPGLQPSNPKYNRTNLETFPAPLPFSLCPPDPPTLRSHKEPPIPGVSTPHHCRWGEGEEKGTSQWSSNFFITSKGLHSPTYPLVRLHRGGVSISPPPLPSPSEGRSYTPQIVSIHSTIY